MPCKFGPRKFGLAAAVLVQALAGCVPPPRAFVAGPPIYCYRSLADVDCYLQPVPNDTLVGAAVPVMPVPVLH